MTKKVSLFIKVKKGTTLHKKQTTQPQQEAPPAPPPPPEVKDEAPVAKIEQTITKSGITIIKKKSSEPSAVAIKPKKSKLETKKTAIKRQRQRQPRPPRPKPVIDPSPSPPTETNDDDDDDDSEIREEITTEEDDKEYRKILKSINPSMTVSLDGAERENLIEKLETYKYKVGKKLKKNKKHGKNTEKYQKQLKVIVKLLNDVKHADNELKFAHNKEERRKIIHDFRKKFKKLKQEEFEKTVDLTAPKEEREPEPSYVLWDKSKKTVFADNSYKEQDARKTKKVLAQITKKSRMDDDMINKIERNKDNNFNKINVNMNHQNLLAYRKYDPFTYHGLTVY